MVNVPIGIAGTIWAYVALREVTAPQRGEHLDVTGNLTLALGVLGIMLGLTYGIMPYGGHAMGWRSPFVIACLAVGVVMLLVFGIVEQRVKQPLFHLGLFRIRAFTFGNIALFAGALARGGLSFMLIIWLQGIFLPLHGVSYENTPLIAACTHSPKSSAFSRQGQSVATSPTDLAPRRLRPGANRQRDWLHLACDLACEL
ncbi:hypothetical protein [Alicyclobacillus sacchari]|uniref:hypothetical protein n=1 Tax=Alicyclobacillus sacchari TaxID=392010 RepID=UPI0024E0789F|nr:hypothetical protein [Alicyclobacillus sacchari]